MAPDGQYAEDPLHAAPHPPTRVIADFATAVQNNSNRPFIRKQYNLPEIMPTSTFNKNLSYCIKFIP